jgi:hypothetical protein
MIPLILLAFLVIVGVMVVLFRVITSKKDDRPL